MWNKIIKRLKCSLGYGHYYDILNEYDSGEVEWKCRLCDKKKVTKDIFDWS